MLNTLFLVIFMRKLILCLLLIMPGVSFATTDAEKNELKRIMVELSVIEDMAKSAQQNREPGDPEQFKYELLLNDLSVIKLGISNHLNKTYDSTYEREPLYVEDRKEY